MSDVIILNASPRKNGNTEILCKECADALESNGIRTEIISVLPFFLGLALRIITSDISVLLRRHYCILRFCNAVTKVF